MQFHITSSESVALAEGSNRNQGKLMFWVDSFRWTTPTSMDEEDVVLTDGTMNHIRVRLASQQVLVEPLTAILEGLSEIDRYIDR